MNVSYYSLFVMRYFSTVAGKIFFFSSNSLTVIQLGMALLGISSNVGHYFIKKIFFPAAFTLASPARNPSICILVSLMLSQR